MKVEVLVRMNITLSKSFCIIFYFGDVFRSHEAVSPSDVPKKHNILLIKANVGHEYEFVSHGSVNVDLEDQSARSKLFPNSPSLIGQGFIIGVLVSSGICLQHLSHVKVKPLNSIVATSQV